MRTRSGGCGNRRSGTNVLAVVPDQEVAEQSDVPRSVLQFVPASPVVGSKVPDSAGPPAHGRDESEMLSEAPRRGYPFFAKFVGDLVHKAAQRDDSDAVNKSRPAR